MSIVRLQQTIARKEVSETMFPPRAPFFSKVLGTSRFPTPLHAHRPKVGP